MTAQTEKLLMQVGLGAAAAMILMPDLFARLVGKVTEGVVGGAGQVIVRTGEGAVLGIGDAIGIPRTDAEKCEAAIKAGNTLDASFYCPAGTFLKSAAGQVYDAVTGLVVGYTTPSGSPEIIAVEPVSAGAPVDIWESDATYYGGAYTMPGTEWDTAA